MPATSDAYCMAERYRCSPRFCTKPARSGWAAAKARSVSEHTCPPASALEPVISQKIPGTDSIARQSAWHCAAGEPASALVSG